MKIEDKFIEGLTWFYQQKYRKAVMWLDDLRRKRTTKPYLMKAEMVVHRLSDEHRETERTLEALKKLPYLSFGMRKSNKSGEMFFSGLTKDVYIMFEKPRRDKSEWVYEALGKYVVAIPMKSMLSSSLNDIHFVPVDHMNISQRHYHHRSLVESPSKNPLDRETATCWGSAGTMILNALEIADVSSVFESCFIFLHQVDWFDRLTDLFWGNRITRTEYQKALGLNAQELTDRQNPEALIFVR